MTTVALAGSSGALAEVRIRLRDSPLDFVIVDDPGAADFTVTDQPAPTPNFATVASADHPNHFFCTDASVSYIVAALTESHLTGATGVRVRRPVQNRPTVGHYRRRPWQRARSPLSSFDPADYDWTSDETIDPEVFDDDVVVTVGEESFAGRLRARGYTDTSDGHFHWAGILHSDRASALKGDGKSRCTVAAADGEPVPAKLAELTQWGTVRMTGVGAPPWS